MDSYSEGHTKKISLSKPVASSIVPGIIIRPPDWVGGGEPLRARKPTTTSLDSNTTQEDYPLHHGDDKVIICGDYIEHYRYTKPLHRRLPPCKRVYTKTSWKPIKNVFAPFEKWLNPPPPRKFRTSSLNRIRRLISSNFGKGMFCT